MVVDDVVVVDEVGGGAVVLVVAPSPVVDDVVPSAGADVEVELEDDVDDEDDVEDEDDVVVSDSIRSVGFRRSPGKLRTGANPPVSRPAVAVRMNLRQISAGKEPPVTARPWTSFISRSWPSG